MTTPSQEAYAAACAAVSDPTHTLTAEERLLLIDLAKALREGVPLQPYRSIVPDIEIRRPCLVIELPPTDTGAAHG